MNKNISTKYFIFILAISMLACQKEVEKVVYVESKSKSSCKTADDLSVEKGFEIQHKRVLVKRIYPVVVHKDCEGKLISKEEQKSYTSVKTIRIEPVKDLKKSDVQKSSAYNRSSCSSNDGRGIKSILTGGFLIDAVAGAVNKKPSINIDINRSSTLLDMKVLEGLNIVEYKFLGKCIDESTEEECNREILEQGVNFLVVDYEKEVVEKIIQPTGCMQ